MYNEVINNSLYSKQIQRGDTYNKARKVVIIAITDFEIEVTKELKRMETIWNIREKAIMDEKALYNTGIREGTELGKKLGREEGKKEGTKETKRKIAKKLISKNMKTEEIMELTGLTKEEIKELKDK